MSIDPRVDIGHVHLKVSDIDGALAFYRDILGFDVTQRMGDQAAFISAGGYHHHLGLNTWESCGGSPPPPETTGLYHVAIRYPDRRSLGDALRRLAEAQWPIDGVVPWVDANLPTIASPEGRVLAGLSAGGFGAFDIGLRHPGFFGRLASWGGYFHPLDDGPFKGASKAELDANDPWLLLRSEAAQLRLDGTRFFVSTGPPHPGPEKPSETMAFGRALLRDGLPVTVMRFKNLRKHWAHESHAGLRWAFRA